MLSTHDTAQLIKEARALRGLAFVVHGHPIGAAVLTTSGSIFGGCNVESHLSGLGRCAEAVAIEHAVAHGEREIIALAVSDDLLTFPCGACLQFLLQFIPKNNTPVYIIAVRHDGTFEQKTLLELLPCGYVSR